MNRLVLILLTILVCVGSAFADPHSKYSKHTALPKEKTGFRLYADAMLTADLSDSTGMKTPVPGAGLTPGAQITPYFFLGAKLGAIYIPHDYFTFPAALNFRWNFGRKNILIIDQSAGVSLYTNKDIHDIRPYVDFSFGGRIPLCPDHFLQCSLGYVIFPQYSLVKDADTGEEHREIMTWISPQLKLSYPIMFKKKNKIRYRVSRTTNPKGEKVRQCSPKTKVNKNEPKQNKKERIEGKHNEPEKTDVEKWKR